MITAEQFLQEAQQKGFSFYSGVPCSYLKSFINFVIDSKDLHYIGATNEGDAVAIASGAEIAGKHGVVMFQNSGFGNAVSPLTSLNMIFQLPVLVITTLRGEPGGPADEPQHQLMGEITDKLFEVMNIPWEFFPAQENEIIPCLDRALRHMKENRTPYGLIMKKDTVESYELKTGAKVKNIQNNIKEYPNTADSRPWRREVLSAIRNLAGENHALVATTGFSGRALYALGDTPNQLYMVGSMGCVSSFGLGIALAKPLSKVTVIDGDGAILMRLGALATVGYERPGNLIHVLLDNEVHDSTGAQSTVSHSVNLSAIAAANGYPQVMRVHTLEQFKEAYSHALQSNELSFIHIKTAPGESKDLPRPKVTPVQVAERFRKFLAENNG